jgi:hypothetical protein
MNTQAQLIEFLETEFGLPEAAIALSLKQAGSLTNLIPIVLWKYGFVTVDQIGQIFDQLETLQPG